MLEAAAGHCETRNMQWRRNGRFSYPMAQSELKAVPQRCSGRTVVGSVNFQRMGGRIASHNAAEPGNHTR